jgi:hypothetical protein
MSFYLNKLILPWHLSLHLSQTTLLDMTEPWYFFCWPFCTFLLGVSEMYHNLDADPFVKEVHLGLVSPLILYRY